MSVFWVAFALITALIALIGEWMMATRQRRVRKVLEQPLDQAGKERRRLYHILFATFMGTLFLALALAGAHRSWVSTIQGVSVVIDAAAFPSEGDSSRQLLIEKGAIVELVRSVPGVTLSLYELRGGAVHLVVPPTIDRLFFELQLDGILSSPPSITDISLSSIQKDVVGRFSGVPPWVVVVSPMNIKPGTKDLDGVASIEIQNEKVLCAVHEAGLSFKGLTIKNAAVKMIERLNRSIKTTAPDPTESWLLGVCTGIALLCFVMWRRANVPMCALGMVLIAASGVFASDIEVNAMVRDAADIAEAKDFDTSQKMVEALLTTVANPQARGRLLYDRALLSYLQGNDTDALLWLNMEPSQEQPLAEAGTLRGLALTRLVATSTIEKEQIQYKKLLREWLESKPQVAQEVAAQASIALFSPSVRVTNMEAVRRTLRWLEENAQDATNMQIDALSSAADLLAHEMNSRVEQRLSAVWPKSVVALFNQDMEKGSEAFAKASIFTKISTIRLWYDFAACLTPNEAVAFLLSEASMLANEALYFPRQAAAAKTDLSRVCTILNGVEPVLLSRHQKLLHMLLAIPAGGDEQRAASWYARAALWPALLDFDPRQLKPVALLLCHEADASTSPLARKTLATVIASASSIPGYSVAQKDPLQGLLQKVLSMWYLQDPEDTLDTVLAFTDKEAQAWAPRLFALIGPSLVQAQKGGQSLTSVMARGVGGDPTALDPVLTGRLWQVAQSSVETPQDVSRDVDHLLFLFSELCVRLQQPTDAVLRSLVLIFSVQPLVFDQLSGAQIFQKDQRRRDTYDQLLSEWNTACTGVQQRIAEPATFRLPKVRQEVESCIPILRRLRALLSESETFPVALPTPEETVAEQRRSFSIRGEDAIRLFQEMDRSDRKLYGE